MFTMISAYKCTFRDMGQVDLLFIIIMISEVLPSARKRPKPGMSVSQKLSFLYLTSVYEHFLPLKLA